MTFPSPVFRRDGQASRPVGLRYNDEGAVGAGFSDTEREILWAKAQSGLLVGQVIEVTCMHLTMDGSFRHPDFVRV
ncbi:hypothetical protein [Bradyrhizobium elkanii]|uniref:hypothetical protein n=1 Tax=Bradyrhizobium elkanii TaxID=29448 RepID=UPI002715185E|nr:hypothetical protein [Bradyrhizobium elkanii]WLB72559.1 hypothetical protein QIH89_00855 [Bradyrhizobium elkanii]